MSLPKLTIIGAGNVGATTAHLALLRGLGHLTLIDVVDGLAQGKALDLLQAAAIDGGAIDVIGTTDYAALTGSRLVVVTAGLARKPGMSRDDLLSANAAIVGGIAQHIAKFAPEAIVLVVTNPLDVMTSLVLKETGFPRHRVLGMAGVLDSGRLKAFVAKELKVSPSSVEAMVLGSHGDLMVPLARTIAVHGKPLATLVEAATVARLMQRTRDGGAEIVALLKQGSAYYAPATSVIAMMEAILKNTRRVLPASVCLQGEYGLQDVCIGVPVELDVTGARRIIEQPLTDDERSALLQAAEQVRQETAKLAALTSAK